ncbi:zinc ABC transporter substrate-binding protein [Bifidobacterium sp. 64T4]|uniref:metal ABC transporter solute-binding protein, Zn/Mn family n=1 Tax=Bifidobacterium pongonis TaxID=2834432 RepID=UPI001C57BC5A|nr:zinc ABC transporter substrate-binding protein [Bifidobacterium pongonis]MBW3094667.1 zinc ABC transporter substrate-binding protein [Bifidobacterium pongonis]
MTRIRKTLAAITACAALLLTATACGSTNADGGNGGNGANNANSANSDAISVVASVNQWGTLAKELGGDLVDVNSIINSTNAEAHDYEPTTADVNRLHNAAVDIVNGADYDAWAVKAAANGNATVVNAAEIGGKKDGDNPHVWFSAEVRTKTADAITAAYRKAMPGKADEFTKLNKSWHAKETELEERIAKVREATKGMTYGATESVARYLADDLGMTDRTPTGYARSTANDSEPTPSEITQFINALRKKKISMLILNTQESNAATEQITTAAKKADVPIIEVSEQMPSSYSSLLDWMSALVGAIGHTS